jgi:site-specific DNA recombinase
VASPGPMGASASTAQTAPTPVRAALYVRVSTQAQAERWSLPAQRKILVNLAERRGWEGVLYDEGGASAETIAARPVMQQLLADVAAGRIDMVAVVEMERLCRASDLRDWATITTTLREAGVLVSTPERTFNLETAEDDFEADLRGILSKREKRKLLERTKRGLDQAKDAGRYAGGTPPTGYRYDAVTRKIVVDPGKADLVQRVFESRLSAWQLHRELAREGLSLSYETIRRIRKNPAYLGLRPNVEGELVQADWPALISEDLWNAQQRRSPRPSRRSPRRDGPAYLLTGMIRCKNCGGPVVGTPVRPAKDGTRLYAYKCLHPRKCPGNGGQMSGRLVDRIVTDALVKYVKDPEILKERYAKALAAVSDPNRAGHRKALQDQLAELDARQARLLEAVEQGVLPAKTVRTRQREIEEARRAVLAELETLDAATVIPSVPELQTLLDLAANLDPEDTAGRRELFQRLSTGVVMNPRERTLVVGWRFGGKNRLPAPTRPCSLSTSS